MFVPKPLLVPLFATILLLASGLPCQAQSLDQESHQGQEASNTRPLMSASEMTTTFFRPQYLEIGPLAKLARNIHGRDISIEEKGGYFASPVSNIQLIDDAMLIYEDAASAQRIIAWCQQMDESMKGDASEKPDLTVTEWRPRNISLMTGYSALSPFHRNVRDYYKGDFVSENQNLTLLKEQGTIVLRDTPRQIAAMLALLDRIDAPEEQLMLTAMVITGQRGAGSGNGDVPAELAEHLAKLVPFSNFRTESVGMVRTSARAKWVEIVVDEGNRLEIHPEVFDTETSTLTARCDFKSASGLRFETRTTISAGEYTVLGASGSQPLFCVLRIERID